MLNTISKVFGIWMDKGRGNGLVNSINIVYSTFDFPPYCL